MTEKPVQRGFFISPNGSELSLRAKIGDRMIRPKRKKERKHRRITLTPFQEVVAFERAIRMRTKILEEYGMWEDLNGSLYMLSKGKPSWVGEEFEQGFMKDLYLNRPDFPEIPALSETARRLKYALDKKQQEKRK